MKGGMICAPENVLNAICYEIGVRELIVQGYLCPLRSKAGSQHPDYDQLHVRGGEFVAGEVEQVMDTDQLVLSACREIVQYTADRRAVLIFAAGVQHGEHVVRVLRERHQLECGFICGETLPFERDETLRRFRSGTLKYLANVNVLTTGFDATHIDCVALLRPTNSPGLFYQMCGRGFRLHPGKTDCLVLDFGGNILRHGPVDQIRIHEPRGGSREGAAAAKECPQCHELIAAGYSLCPQCAYVFPAPERQPHAGQASTEGVLSDEVQRSEYEVQEVYYAEHVKRNAPPEAPHTLRVDYKIAFNTYVSEWVCFEHDGWPREKAEAWWRTRADSPPPTMAAEAAARAPAELAAPLRITVEKRAGDRFDRVVDCVLGDKPEICEPPAGFADALRRFTGAHRAQAEEPTDPTPAGDPCPNCQRYDRAVQDPPGVTDGTLQEVCAWCGQWLRWVSPAEQQAFPIEEIPF
jgi:DNA repair protein RadD